MWLRVYQFEVYLASGTVGPLEAFFFCFFGHWYIDSFPLVKNAFECSLHLTLLMMLQIPLKKHSIRHLGLVAITLATSQVFFRPKTSWFFSCFCVFFFFSLSPSRGLKMSFRIVNHENSSQPPSSGYLHSVR